MIDTTKRYARTVNGVDGAFRDAVYSNPLTHYPAQRHGALWALGVAILAVLVLVALAGCDVASADVDEAVTWAIVFGLAFVGLVLLIVDELKHDERDQIDSLLEAGKSSPPLPQHLPRQQTPG